MIEIAQIKAAQNNVENVDFTGVKSFTVVNNGAKKELDNHLLKISMAKEISMLQRNDKGKQARLYFIVKARTPATLVVG